MRGRDGRSVRQTAVQLLLDHTHDEIIRNLIAFEIADHTRNEAQELLWQGAVSYRQLFQTAQNRLTTETNRVNAVRGTALTVIQLLESDPTESDPELRTLKTRYEAVKAAQATIQEWAGSEPTVRDYLTQHIGRSMVMLTYYNDVEADRPMTSTMDALATILGVNLEIYVQAYEEEIADQTVLTKSKPLTLVHRFKGGDTKTIRMVNVAYDPAEPENLNHFNRLEETQDFTKAAHHVEEHFEEEYGAVVTEEGYDISLPFATVATFAGNVVDGVKWVESATQIRAHDESAKAKAIIAKEALEAGVSEQETATIQQEVDSVYDDVAEANAIINSLKEKQELEQAPGKRSTQTKGNAKVIDEPLLFAGARSPSGQTPISQTSMSSKAATDKPIYGQTKTGLDQATSVPLAFDQPRQLANQQDEAALVYALNKLSRATTKIESLGEQYPGIRSGLGFAAQVIEIGARTAYYVKMTASGSAAGLAVCGPLAANPYGAAVCSIGGGVAGLTAAFGTEQVIASGFEKGIEETSKAAGRQGRTAEESAKFEESVQNTAFYLGALGSIFGVKKVAGNVKGGGKGKTVQFADEVHAPSNTHNFSMSGQATGKLVQNQYITANTQGRTLPKPSDRPLESPYYSSSFKATLKEGEHYPGIPDRIHFQECNKQLHLAMQADLELASQFETLYPGITKAVAPGAKGAFPTRFPPNLELTWHHHPQEIGVLELIPRAHHRGKGAVQQTLHPDGKGGREIWGGGRDK